jgi:predicted enzyme related to lactoylglutathione lyase
MKPGMVVLFVSRFERSLRFYQELLAMKPTRMYRGKEHPRYAAFQVGDVRIALHGGRPKSRFEGSTFQFYFDVTDISDAADKIRKYGGRVEKGPMEISYKPAEEMRVKLIIFTDPEGHRFGAQQVMEGL